MSGTQTARRETALVVPYYGTGRAHPAGEPLHTVSTRDRFGVAFVAELRGGGSTSRDVAQPLATVCASGTHHMLVHTTTATGPGAELDPRYPSLSALSAPPVTGGCGHTRPVIEDCMFRMLTVAEISAAMAFTSGYQIRGNKRDQVRQLGNAVTPPAAEWLIRAVVTSLACS